MQVLPISRATEVSFVSVLEIRRIFIPCLASCLEYSRPMPSVLPVITAKGILIKEACKIVKIYR
jgi:hypothetical protein